MASRHSTTAVVALITLLAACTEATVESDPTVPPGVFAPTPSIEDDSTPTTTSRPAPITTADVDRAVIVRVDPYTLEPLPFLAPIPMGDSVWGQPSPGGAYFAATAWDDTTGSSEIRLIDVKAWGELGSWREVVDSELTVDDEGAILFVGTGKLRSLKSGMSESQPIADLPTGFYPWLGRLVGGRYVAFGARHDAEVELEVASLVLVDIDSGTLSMFDIPGMRVGNLEADNSEPWSGYLYAVPGVALDAETRRALVVHPDRDVVSEIDLTTGMVTDHEYPSSAGADPLQPTDGMALQRSVALSPDGGRLHVSGRRLALDAADESWSVTTAPLGVVTLDTRTWEVSSRLVEPVVEVFLAPDGRGALAWGYTSTEGDTDYQMETHGLYVLSGEDMAVIAHHPADASDQWYGPFTFNDTAGVGYVSTWVAGNGRLDVIDLSSGQVLTSSEDEGYRQMFGSIGVLGVETP